MAWNDTKIEDGGATAAGKLTATEWNNHVTDQETRLALSGGTLTGNIVMSGTSINMSGGDVNEILVADFGTEFDNGTVSGTATIDWNNGNMQKVTLSDNVTLSYTDPTGAGRFDLRVIQDVSGGNAVTWPGSQFWPGGAAPTITAGSNTYDIVTVRYRGTGNYDGAFTQDFS